MGSIEDEDFQVGQNDENDLQVLMDGLIFNRVYVYVIFVEICELSECISCSFLDSAVLYTSQSIVLKNREEIRC